MGECVWVWGMCVGGCVYGVWVRVGGGGECMGVCVCRWVCVGECVGMWGV